MAAGRGHKAEKVEAVRGLLAHKGFTATAIATLALGIGANAAIFSEWFRIRSLRGE